MYELEEGRESGRKEVVVEGPPTRITAFNPSNPLGKGEGIRKSKGALNKATKFPFFFEIKARFSFAERSERI